MASSPRRPINVACLLKEAPPPHMCFDLRDR
jgi:hypothetical protein